MMMGNQKAVEMENELELWKAVALDISMEELTVVLKVS